MVIIIWSYSCTPQGNLAGALPPLERQVKPERINRRHRITSVIHPESNGRTTQFRCISRVMLPRFQILNIYIELSVPAYRS